MKKDERLDSGIEESMDASDPVSVETDKKPAPSSGFPEPEKAWTERVKGKLFNK